MSNDYPDIFGGKGGSNVAALAAASTAMETFVLFVTPRLLEFSAGTSNDYSMENLDARGEAHLAKQRALKKKKQEFQVKSPDFVKQTLLKMQDISEREIVVFLVLLMARKIAPNKEKFDNHWKTTDKGTIPRGCFNAFILVMAFDETMFPCTSPFNRMRVFMKDKPHRWGTKLFMLCYSTSAYCMR
ncbi:hypothetical protein PHMEG_00028880 [Phytophthora megakarya]|uniref:PiggyBac transposable element-derived protein domain-containing protein n=1 Tax=Phytophthora megakarya TaxID=4795 RepID=A0A225V3E3_9STRA|nr:hypothetical protein PHMEG_00028880 [Phytophthora megakarya]